MSLQLKIKTVKEDERIVEGAVYTSNIVDAHGDFIDTANLVKFYDYVEALSKEEKNKLFDVNHNRKSTKAEFQYHFVNGIHRQDDKYPYGAWVVATKVDNNEWAKVKSGDLNAYSMDFFARVKEVDAAIVVVKENYDLTETVEDHDHVYYLRLDEMGRVVGGCTSIDAGHGHEIDGAVVTKGYIDENGKKHKHRLLQS